MTEETCYVSTLHTYTRHTMIMLLITVHCDQGHPPNPRPCHHQQLLHQLYQILNKSVKSSLTIIINDLAIYFLEQFDCGGILESSNPQPHWQ